jgi:hypothetical protein
LLHFVPRCPLGLILSATTRGYSPTLPRLCFKPHCSHPAAWLGSLPTTRIPETDTPLKTRRFAIKFMCKMHGLLHFVPRCPLGLILSATTRGKSPTLPRLCFKPHCSRDWGTECILSHTIRVGWGTESILSSTVRRVGGTEWILNTTVRGIGVRNAF